MKYNMKLMKLNKIYFKGALKSSSSIFRETKNFPLSPNHGSESEIIV